MPEVDDVLGVRTGAVEQLLGAQRRDVAVQLQVTAAVLNGAVMAVYSVLLIRLNRTYLPPAIRVRGARLGTLVRAVVLFGGITILTAIAQFQLLTEGWWPRSPPGPSSGVLRIGPSFDGAAGRGEHAGDRSAAVHPSTSIT